MAARLIINRRYTSYTESILKAVYTLNLKTDFTISFSFDLISLETIRMLINVDTRGHISLTWYDPNGCPK